MSMHKKPVTDLEREGLILHGLGRYVGKPSQLADVFRQGIAWALDYKEPRTSQQIVDDTVEVALQLYEFMGYVAKPGFKFWESKHPTELMVWAMACAMQEHFTDTDVDDALTDLEDGTE